MGNKQQKPQSHITQIYPINSTISLPQISNQSSNQSSINYNKEYFMLDPLQNIQYNIHLQDQKVLWVDKSVYYDQMIPIIQKFNRSFQHFQEFQDLNQFKTTLQRTNGSIIFKIITSTVLSDQMYKIMNRNRYVDQIILFSQNPIKVRQLKIRFSKIKRAGRTCKQILFIIGEPINYKNTILYMVPEDIAALNKYWLNYHCLVNHKNIQKAKQDFINISKSLHSQQNQIIEKFNEQYRLDLNDNQRYSLITNWIFKDTFYWKIIQKLPKITNDPKKLAYLRLSIKDIYQTILKRYRQSQQIHKIIYLVVDLSEDQKDKIGQCLNNYLIFTSFVKGFTSQKQANDYFKSNKGEDNNLFLFDVIIPKRESLYSQMDFGFLIKTQQNKDISNSNSFDVVFNIFNYFKLTDIQKKPIQRGTLIYGGLADTYNRRINDQSRRLLGASEKDLLRISDNITSSANKIYDQGSVLRSSGYISQSIIHSQSVIADIRRSGSPQSQLDRVNLQIADSLALTEDYDSAINMYLNIKTQTLQFIGKIRVVEIELQKRFNFVNAHKYFQQIFQQIQNLRKWELFEEYYRVRYFKCKLLMQDGYWKQANKQFVQLKGQIQKNYDYKTSHIPFMQGIFENIQICSIKLNNKINQKK